MTTIFEKGIFLLYLFAAQPLHSQNLECEWLHSFGGEQTDWGMDAASDSQGNFIIAGKFSGDIDIDPSDNVHILSSTESSDSYIAKYSPNQELIWAFSIGGSSDENILLVEIVSDDNILVCGYFNGTCDFDPSDNVYPIESLGYGDAFIACYSTDGQFIWARAVGGGANTDKAWSCTSDTSGNIYFGGYFIDGADLDPSASEFLVTVPNGTTPDLFLVKLSPEGEFIWAGTMGGSGLEYPYGMCVDDEQNLVVSGLIEGSIDFDLSDAEQIFDSPNGATGMNCYIAKYSADGDLMDARIFGGVGDDVARTMIATDTGFLIGGWYAGAGDFDPGNSNLNLPVYGDKDAFLIQLDFDFNAVWAYYFGNDGEDTFKDLAIDQFGNIVASGSFEKSIDFDSGDEEFILAVPETFEGVYTDAFVLVLSPEGQFKEAQNFGGWKSDNGYGVAVSDNKVLLLGNFEYEATSGACSATVNSAGEPYSDDVFAICFNSEYLLVENEILVQPKLFPNPADQFINIAFSKLELLSDVEIELYDMQGRFIRCVSLKHNQATYMLDCTSLENGTYLLNVGGERFVTTKKIVVTH